MKLAGICVLYVSYYFPPLGGIASIRALKNVKYLRELGCEVQVLTAQTALLRHPRDPGLQKELPSGITVWRAWCPDAEWLFKLLYGLRLGGLVRFLRQRVFFPDPQRLCLPFARRKLNQLMKADAKPEIAVISSGPPSSLSLGLILKDRFGVPFICDFRDEWTNNPERINLDYPARVQSRELLMESRVLRGCAGVSYLTELMRRNFVQHHSCLKGKPSAIIPNGFDAADFSGLEPTNHRGCFHLVYCGSFYDRRQPDSLWTAISSLLQAGRIEAGSLCVDVIGKNTPAFVLGSFANDPAIRDCVKFHGFMPHRESLRAMLKAEALLLYIPSGRNADSVLTGKIFDYLASGKPILAIVPPRGLAAEIVLRAGTGFVADYQDIPGIAAALLHLYELWRQGGLGVIKPDREYVSSFSRRSQAEKLAGLIEEVLS